MNEKNRDDQSERVRGRSLALDESSDFESDEENVSVNRKIGVTKKRNVFVEKRSNTKVAKKKCPVCHKGFNKNSLTAECRRCDSLTHQRHIEDDFDEDNYVCKRCNENEHSVGESELEVMSSDENNANDNEKNENSLGESEDIETVFETVEVIADYGNNGINSIEADSEIIEVPVVDIEVSPISLTLEDKSFSVPNSQKVKMTAARQMAINSVPDKLEQNNPSDEVGYILDSVRDDFHMLQSDVDLERSVKKIRCQKVEITAIIYHQLQSLYQLFETVSSDRLSPSWTPLV